MVGDTSYEMQSYSERHHRVSWPDGVSVDVYHTNAVAMQIGQGRALLRELASSARSLEAASGRMQKLVDAIEGERTVLSAYVDTIIRPVPPSSTNQETKT